MAKFPILCTAEAICKYLYIFFNKVHRNKMKCEYNINLKFFITRKDYI